MKKLTFFILFVSIAVSFTACKKKENLNKETSKETTQYYLDSDNVNVQWTAYKTSEKVPVKGVFKTVQVNSTEAETQIKVLNNAEFNIPISSIFSKDSIRDGKLQKFFFNVMDNTIALTGKITSIENNNGKASLTMNGVTKDLPFTYTVVGDTIKLNSTLMLDQWNATKALASLNEACKELHTGKDGISKTWNEVNIHINVLSKTK